MHKYMTKFGSNYVHIYIYIYTECNTTLFERPFDMSSRTTRCVYKLTKFYYESTFTLIGTLTYVFKNTYC